MIYRQRLAEVFSGVFMPASTLIDWYLNAPLRSRPLTEEELFRYETFLERPLRAFSPPDPANGWWMVLAVAAAMYFLGHMLAKLAVGLFQSRNVMIHSVYLKIITLAGLMVGLSAGYLVFVTEFRLPTVWKIHTAIIFAAAMFLWTWSMLWFPRQLYLLWRRRQ